jgi:hypothetical protein
MGTSRNVSTFHRFGGSLLGVGLNVITQGKDNATSATTIDRSLCRYRTLIGR